MSSDSQLCPTCKKGGLMTMPVNLEFKEKGIFGSHQCDFCGQIRLNEGTYEYLEFADRADSAIHSN